MLRKTHRDPLLEILTIERAALAVALLVNLVRELTVWAVAAPAVGTLAAAW